MNLSTFSIKFNKKKLVHFLIILIPYFIVFFINNYKALWILIASKNATKLKGVLVIFKCKVFYF